MGELASRIKRFYRWEVRERRDIIVTILVVSLIFAFDDGRATFEPVLWILNFLLTIIIVGVSILAYDFAMKVSALQQGFRAEYRMWPQGLAIGAVIALLTGGKWIVLLHGGLFLHHMMILRLGKFRYGINTIAQGTIAAMGPVAHLILLTFALAMSKQFGIMPVLFDNVARINGLLMIYQLLPIPRLNGIHIFFMSRLAYVFIASTLVAYGILSLAGIFSWIISLLIGGVCWLAWYWYGEGGKSGVSG